MAGQQFVQSVGFSEYVLNVLICSHGKTQNFLYQGFDEFLKDLVGPDLDQGQMG